MKKNERRMSRFGAALVALLLAGGTVLPLASCTQIPQDPPATDSESQTEPSGSVTPSTPIGNSSVIFRDAAGAVLDTVSGTLGGTVKAYVPVGYRSVRYFTDVAMTQEISSAMTFGASDATVYVSWSDPITYKVALEAGQGLGETVVLDATYDARLTLPECTFTKKGETFSEWRLYDADGGYRSFIDGAPIKNLTEKNGEVVRLVAVYDTVDAESFTVVDGVVTAYTGNATSVVFPQQAHSISADVFRDCATAANIKKIVVPDDYRSIACGAFAPCTKLESLTVPFIGGSRTADTFIAFVFGAETYLDNTYRFTATVDDYYGLLQGDLDLEKQVVPATLKHVTVTGELYTVPEGAFYMVYGLEKLSIPHCESLYAIGDRAFDGCWQLGYDSTYGTQNPLWWLENVETIGKRAFAAYISDDNANGEAYTFTRIFQIPRLSKIRSIGSEAFYANLYLMNAEFGDGLVTIGKQAFTNCASLGSLILPDSVQTIGEYAFTSCQSMETLYIGKSIRSIGAFAFADCAQLGTVTVAAESPAMVTYIPFSNGVNDKIDISGQVEGYKPTFTVLSFVVPAASLEKYRTEWVAYASMIRSDAKEERGSFYYGDLGDGTFAAGLTFDGKTLQLEDPLGEIGELLDPFGAYSTGKSLSLFWEEIDTETVGEERFYKLWSPEILDPYQGSPYEIELRVRPMLYEADGKTYRISVAEQVSYFDTTLGKNDTESLWQIREDAYLHASLYTRESVTDEWTAVAAPEGTVYTECYLYAQLWYSYEYMAIVYEDANGEPIAYRYFFSRDGMLIPAESERDGVAMVFYSSTGIQFILDGAGTAKINLFDGGLSSIREYVGAYEQTGGEWGDESLTFRFTSLVGKDGTLTGEVTFDGFFADRYHRGDYRLSLNGTPFKTDTIYTSVDLDARDCVDRNTGNYFTLYDYKDENGEIRFRYASYTSGGATNHGTYTVDGNKIEIKIKNYSKNFTGTVTDRRGTLEIAGAAGNVTYHRADDEGYTFRYTEDFYGTTLEYYAIAMDGYGSAVIHDTHDDNTDEYYIGTYYNTGRSVGSDSYGEYWVYCFEGQECYKNGTLKDGGKTATYYYVVSTTLDDANEGTIFAISRSGGEETVEAYDGNGQLFATLSIDPFGITEITVMKLGYENGEAVYTADTELSEKLVCTAYLDGSGNVSFVVVMDGEGSFLFILTAEDGEWFYGGEGLNDPKPAPNDFVTPDLTDAETVG